MLFSTGCRRRRLTAVSLAVILVHLCIWAAMRTSPIRDCPESGVLLVTLIAASSVVIAVHLVADGRPRLHAGEG